MTGDPPIGRKRDSIDINVGAPEELKARLEDIFTEFSEAYCEAEEGSGEIDLTIFQSLINRAKDLVNDPDTDRPQTRALLSHMLLESARLPAMAGEKRDIKSQDRRLWDKVLIEQGLSYLKSSAEGSAVSVFHLKAAVSACHSLANDWRSTDWKHILSLYDSYLEFHSSAELALERTAVLSKFKGARAEIKGIEEILLKYNIGNEHLLYEKLGDLRCRLHEYRDALLCYEKALAGTESKSDKTNYRKKIRYCKMRLSYKEKYARGLSF